MALVECSTHGRTGRSTPFDHAPIEVGRKTRVPRGPPLLRDERDAGESLVDLAAAPQRLDGLGPQHGGVVAPRVDLDAEAPLRLRVAVERLLELAAERAEAPLEARALLALLRGRRLLRAEAPLEVLAARRPGLLALRERAPLLVAAPLRLADLVAQALDEVLGDARALRARPRALELGPRVAEGRPQRLDEHVLLAARRPGQEKGAKFPTSKAPISVVFRSFRPIFGRAIISRSALDAWMFSPERARAERSR